MSEGHDKNNGGERPQSAGTQKARVSRGLPWLVAALSLYVTAWILVYFIQTSQATSSLSEALGVVAYFCSVLPFGPAILFLIGLGLAITDRPR